MKKNEKKITFIIGSMGRGGAERVISILANHYADLGFSVDIILLLADKNDYVLNKSITVLNYSGNTKLRWRRLPYWLKSIRSYLKESNSHKIISFVARINVITLIAGLGLNKKIIISERNDPKSDGRNLLLKLLTYVLYPLAECIVFQTTYAKECFPKFIQKKNKIIYNPVSVPVLANNNIAQKRFVTVGRLTKQKNHDLLINTFSKIAEKYPEYTLDIFGEGELRAETEQKIKTMDLDQKVILHGNVLNVHEQIKDAEIFILSSDYEGLSNALMEAMTMGLPCISTNYLGADELIDNDVNGLLVPVGDEKALESAITRLIKNKKLAVSIGENAANKAEIFNYTTILKQWDELIM